MSVSFCLIPVADSDTSFLNDLYASTRAEEMALVPWDDEQKQAFLKMQFEAQNQHYRERYPNASFEIIKQDDKLVGRFYLAELADEIRIIDIAFLPQYFDKKLFTKIINTVLQKSAIIGKPVQIYLESFNPQTEIFIQTGFQKAGEHGIYFLWRYEPASIVTNKNNT